MDNLKIFLVLISMLYGISHAEEGLSFFRRDISISYICDLASINDIDGDSNADIISYSRNGCVSILPGNGNGSFEEEVVYITNETDVTSLIVCDFSNDNLADIIVGESILLNQGNSVFLQKKIDLPKDLTKGGVFGDINNDGNMDLIKHGFIRRGQTGNSALPEFMHYIKTILGKGDGSFEVADSLWFGESYGIEPMTCNDFDGDGKDELLLGIMGVQGSTILLYDINCNTTNMIFRFDLSYVPGFYFYALPAADYNGDGNIDLSLVLGDTPGRFDRYVGDGEGSFTLIWQGGFDSKSIKYSNAFSINLNKDIFPDIGFIVIPREDLQGKPETYRMCFRNGRSNGAFDERIISDISLPPAYYAYSGDFNNDSLDDVIIPFAKENKIALYTNNGLISSVSDNTNDKEFKEYNLFISPNPFNSHITIQYYLNEESLIEVYVYDMFGRKVRTLTHGVQKPGNHLLYWKGDDDCANKVASGLYLLAFRDRKNNVMLSKKLLYLK